MGLHIISHGFSKNGLEFEGKPRPTLEGSIRIMAKWSHSPFLTAWARAHGWAWIKFQQLNPYLPSTTEISFFWLHKTWIKGTQNINIEWQFKEWKISKIPTLNKIRNGTKPSHCCPSQSEFQFELTKVRLLF